PLGLHPLDCNLERAMLVALVQNLPPEAHAGRERSIQFDAEPLSKCLGVRQRPPHPGTRRAKKNTFLDAVCAHVQSPGCILTDLGQKRNWIVAVPGLQAGAAFRCPAICGVSSPCTSLRRMLRVLRDRETGQGWAGEGPSTIVARNTAAPHEPNRPATENPQSGSQQRDSWCVNQRPIHLAALN